MDYLSSEAIEVGARAYCDFLSLNPDELVFDGGQGMFPRWEYFKVKIVEAAAIKHALERIDYFNL